MDIVLHLPIWLLWTVAGLFELVLVMFAALGVYLIWMLTRADWTFGW